ncbi:MAG: sigma-70 family RNA polymerase sigma factor [Lentisphaerales bacterium]|nr:sigma-70 family RNA polymerase sigma factor [Lentisphaerales bacterium]
MSTNRQSDFLKMAFDARPVLTAYAFTLLKDWGLAQDIFQDAVISMNEKYEDIQKESPLSWLKMVIRNKAVDYIRKQERTSRNHEQLLPLVDKKFDALLEKEKIEFLKEKEKALQDCMAKLESDSQNILVEFYRHKKSCLSLSELYGKTANAIRLTLSRSRAQLRQCVKIKMEEA